MCRLRLVVFIILAFMAILPGSAQAAPAASSSFVVSDSNGNRLAQGSVSGPESCQITLDQAQSVTVSVSAPGFLISSGAYRRVADALELAVYASDGGVVNITVAGEGGTITYTLCFSIKKQHTPEPEPKPEPKPEQPGGQEPEAETPDRDEPEADEEEAGESRPLPPGPGSQWPDAGSLAEELAARYPFQEDEASNSDGEIRLYLRISSATAFINGRETQLDAAPFIDQGYTMVPVRFVAEALGSQVYWDGAGRVVTIAFGGRVFDLKVGQPVPGYPVAAQLVNGRTFVPLRYVMESFGAEVSWDGANRSIDIIYPGF